MLFNPLQGELPVSASRLSAYRAQINPSLSFHTQLATIKYCRFFSDKLRNINKSPRIFSLHQMKLPLLLFILFMSPFLTAQTPVYRNFTHADGLPSSETYCIIQDAKGYIWIGSDRGLIKYDGGHFQTFTSMEGLPDNTIFDITEDAQNRLWLNTYSSKIGYLKNDSAFVYPFNEMIKKVLPYQLLTGMYVSDNEDLWFLKKVEFGGFILSKIDAKGTISRVNPEAKKRIYINKDGKCFVSGDYSPGYRELIRLESGESLGSIYTSDTIRYNIYASKPDETGKYFMAYNHKVFSIHHGVSKQICSYPGELLAFKVDEHANIWLGIRHDGLLQFESSSNYQVSNWLIQDISPTSIIKDKEGAIWVSSLEKGVFYFFPLLPKYYDEKSGFSTRKIRRVVKANNYRFVLLANDAVVTLDHKELCSPKAPVNDSINDLTFRADSGLYAIGTNRLLPSTNLQVVHLGFGKRIVCGTHFNWVIRSDGILKYHLDRTLLETISFENRSRPTCLYELTKKSVLIGTLEGLYLKNEQGIHFLGKTDSSVRHRITAIYRIDSAHLMLTTIGSGIIILRQKDLKAILHYTTKDGLPSMMCNSAFIEADKTIWVATNRGVCKIIKPLNREHVKFSILNVEDGLISNEVNDIQIIDNDIWASTVLGLSILSKQIAQKQDLDFPMVITRVSVNEDRFDPSIKGIFAPGQNNIHISFTGLTFWHPKKIIYRYRLLGVDTTWHKGMEHSVVYNSLSPGNYKFEVMAIAPDGNINLNIGHYAFQIKPRVYQTWWFKTLSVLLMITLVVFVIQNRVTFVRKQEQLKGDLYQFRDRALRNQMNPHFIYNTLNSIQNYILKNDSNQSAEILAKFSQLMRLTFNNTSQERVTLAADLEALQLYVSLEQIRFGNRFSITIELGPQINPEAIYIPPLLLQPFIENSIIHGLATQENGQITIELYRSNDALQIEITDNGVGRNASGKIKDKKNRFNQIFGASSLKRKSSGIETTRDRIEQLWVKKNNSSGFEIIDLYDETQHAIGTKIIFSIPC